MKSGKLLLAALLALALLLTAACGQAASPPQTEETPAPTPSPSPEPTPALPALPEAMRLPSLSPEESQAMASFLNANRALVWGDRLYCYDFGKDWAPVLARYTWRDGELTDFTVLAEDCVPEYLCRETGWLYFIDRNSGSILRVTEKGGTPQVLRKDPSDWLFFKDGRLYFCDSRGRFLSMEPGMGKETLLFDGPCSFAFPLGETVLYRDAGSGQLRLHRLADGTDLPLSQGPASPALIAEDRLWYHSGEKLCSLRLDGTDERVYPIPANDGAVELLPEAEGLTLRGLRMEDGPLQWYGGPEGPFRTAERGYRICDWMGEGVRIDTVYEPDGRIRGLVLTDEDGTEIPFLAGEQKS